MLSSTRLVQDGHPQQELYESVLNCGLQVEIVQSREPHDDALTSGLRHLTLYSVFEQDCNLYVRPNLSEKYHAQIAFWCEEKIGISQFYTFARSPLSLIGSMQPFVTNITSTTMVLGRPIAHQEQNPPWHYRQNYSPFFVCHAMLSLRIAAPPIYS
jgi:hypothetical protein